MISNKKMIYVMTKILKNNQKRVVHLSQIFSCFGFVSFCFPAAYSMAQIQDPELHFGSAFQALLDIKEVITIEDIAGTRKGIDTCIPLRVFSH